MLVFCNKVYREWLPYKVLLTLGKLFNQGFSTEFFFCIIMFTALYDVWTPAEQLPKTTMSLSLTPDKYHNLGSCSPVINFIMPSGLSCSVLPSFHLWTLPTPLCQFLKESCTYCHQTDKLLVDQAGHEFLGSNHKHLASTEGAANPSAVTDPQLCLLPIAAWQRLWVAFRKT